MNWCSAHQKEKCNRSVVAGLPGFKPELTRAMSGTSQARSLILHSDEDDQRPADAAAAAEAFQD